MLSVKHPRFTLDCLLEASSSFSPANMRYLAFAGGWKKDTAPRVSQSGRNAGRVYRLLSTPNVISEIMKIPSKSILCKVRDTSQLELIELIRAGIFVQLDSKPRKLTLVMRRKMTLLSI